jgi:flagella basal body P-ring formation protein FlgA
MNRRPIPANDIEAAIIVVRGQKVLLDYDLARLYGVEAKALNQAVRRNIERFPGDFMFRLTLEEVQRSRSQTVTLNAEASETTRVSPGRPRRGTNIKYLPFAFTEQGVAMLSSVLRSPRAVQVNVEIMRAFVRLRRLLQSNAELAAKLAELEKKYDGQFKIVFDAIRELMTPPETPKRPIGFGG